MRKILISIGIVTILAAGCSNEKKENRLLEGIEVEHFDVISKLDSSMDPDEKDSIFSEGLLVVKDHKTSKKGFVDKTGKWVIKPNFNNANSFSEGLAAATNDKDLYGYIDKSGAWVIEPRYRHVAQNFSEGLAMVQDKDSKNLSFIDRQGNRIIELDSIGLSLKDQFFNPVAFNDGLAPVGTYSGYGFIDKTGEWIIEPEYHFASSFYEGLALVQDGSLKYGFMDMLGNWVIEPTFGEDIGYYFSDGLVLDKGENDQWGYRDKTGDWAIEPQFERAANFSEGLAWVSGPGRYQSYFIDTTGNPAISLPSGYASKLVDGLSLIGRQDGYYVISSLLVDYSEPD